jgi:hypothetical protein
MTDATLLWSIWQALLQSFAWAFTRPGHRRFAEWVTALALNAEERTITQSVLAIERPALCPAARTASLESEVGPPIATAPPGRPVDQALARGDCLHLRPPAEGPLEGGRLRVAGLGA